jgi:hypothetical protein
MGRTTRALATAREVPLATKLPPSARVSRLAAGSPPQRCSSAHTTSRTTAAPAGVTCGQGSENGHVGLVALPTARTRYIYASLLGIFRLGGPRLLFIDDTDSVGDELAVPARWLRAPAPARPDPDGRRRPSLATAMSGRIRSSPSRS